MRHGRRTIHNPKRAASTRDIVGETKSEFVVPVRWRRHYRRLLNLRESIHNQQTALAKEALQEHPAFSMHMADAGTDAFDRDLALSMLSSDQSALNMIDQALDRIRSGTYGVCELTGKRIEAERLLAIPWTRFTAEAERQLEREGLERRARLAARETVANSRVPEKSHRKNP